MVERINLFSSETGVTATVDSGVITLTAEDGRDIAITENSTVGTSGFSTGTLNGQVSLTASDNITFGGTQAAVVGTTEIVRDTSTLDNVSITTVENAEDAIARIDAALSSVNGFRSDLGAIQNRLESTIVNIQTTSENLAASRGRIQDADFAAETANLTRAQILQQAGVAMLSQANAQPQIALSLLG